MENDNKYNYVMLQSVHTLLNITQLDYRKLYLVIICPNSYDNFEIIRPDSRKSYLVILGPKWIGVGFKH